MVINVVVRNIERNCQLSVSLQPGTFIVALQRVLSAWRIWYASSSVAPDFFLLALTITSNDDLERTCFLLSACRRRMARLFARMATSLLWLSAFLLAMHVCIFTISRSVAGLSACVTTTFEMFTTNQAAKNISTPAWLVLECLLTTKAWFFCQEGTLWAFFLVTMAVVCNSRMAAGFLTLTREVAGRRSSTAGKWCLQDCPATVTSEIIEYGLFTGAAGTFVT